MLTCLINIKKYQLKLYLSVKFDSILKAVLFNIYSMIPTKTNESLRYLAPTMMFEQKEIGILKIAKTDLLVILPVVSTSNLRFI